ncbi:phage tail tape measure protein [Vibrio cyclitrophicus]
MLPEALRFQVGLIDQISKPLGNIQRQMTDVTNTYRQGTHTMMAGAAGMVGAGFALQQALMPAIEMDRALGEVKSLGVADEQLKQLSDTALEFAVDYGKSAADFVAASYDIQSAISGLGGNELSEFTRASGVLAAATKADTSTITNYVGTMYGIFQNSANEMGKADWVNVLGGQTAKAVQMFKTTGEGMSSAFTSVGAAATSVGVGMTEQMAILGTLQSTMSGSEAGTKYRAFLAGTAKAQEALNMQFTNAQGQMLPIVDILNQIKGRYGETISVAEAAELSKAFGTQEATAMIQLLMQNTDGLATSINELGKVKGLDVAEQMAGAMTDQWERLEQGVFAISAAFGAVLLPAILPVVGGMAEGATAIVQWTQMFPNLTKYIGFAAIAILGAAVAGGAFTLMMGVGKQAMATYMLALKALVVVKQGYSALIKVLRISLLALHMNMNIYGVKTKLVTAGQWLLNGAMSASATIFGTATTALMWFGRALMTGSMAAMKFTVSLMSMAATGLMSVITALGRGTMAALRFSAALLANPIGLVFAGIVAAIGAVIYYWDDLKAAFGDMAWFKPIESVFNYFAEILTDLKESFNEFTDWIPGFGSDDEAAPVKSKSVERATPHAQIQPGGAARSIASYQTSSTNYGGVAIYPTYMNSPQDMASELEMAAG